MTIKELRESLLKKSNGLQRPKHIVLSNADYSSLKEEIEEMRLFLDIKNGRDGMRFNNVNIIPESEFLDLRK